MPTLAEIRIVCLGSMIGTWLFSIVHHYSIANSSFWMVVMIGTILFYVGVSIAVEEDCYENRIEGRISLPTKPKDSHD